MFNALKIEKENLQSLHNKKTKELLMQKIDLENTIQKIKSGNGLSVRSESKSEY